MGAKNAAVHVQVTEATWEGWQGPFFRLGLDAVHAAFESRAGWDFVRFEKAAQRTLGYLCMYCENLPSKTADDYLWWAAAYFSLQSGQVVAVLIPWNRHQKDGPERSVAIHTQTTGETITDQQLDDLLRNFALALSKA